MLAIALSYRLLFSPLIFFWGGWGWGGSRGSCLLCLFVVIYEHFAQYKNFQAQISMLIT